MPLLTPQVIATAGLTPAYSAAVASTTVPCGERTFLHVKNTGGTPVTVTLTATGRIRGQLAADMVVTVPATTGDKMIGPIPAELFASPVDGNCAVTYSALPNVTAALLAI